MNIIQTQIKVVIPTEGIYEAISKLESIMGSTKYVDLIPVHESDAQYIATNQGEINGEITALFHQIHQQLEKPCFKENPLSEETLKERAEEWDMTLTIVKGVLKAKKDLLGLTELTDTKTKRDFWALKRSAHFEHAAYTSTRSKPGKLALEMIERMKNANNKQFDLLHECYEGLNNCLMFARKINYRVSGEATTFDQTDQLVQPFFQDVKDIPQEGDIDGYMAMFLSFIELFNVVTIRVTELVSEFKNSPFKRRPLELKKCVTELNSEFQCKQEKWKNNLTNQKIDVLKINREKNKPTRENLLRLFEEWGIRNDYQSFLNDTQVLSQPWIEGPNEVLRVIESFLEREKTTELIAPLLDRYSLGRKKVDTEEQELFAKLKKTFREFTNNSKQSEKQEELNKVFNTILDLFGRWFSLHLFLLETPKDKVELSDLHFFIMIMGVKHKWIVEDFFDFDTKNQKTSQGMQFLRTLYDLEAQIVQKMIMVRYKVDQIKFNNELIAKLNRKKILHEEPNEVAVQKQSIQQSIVLASRLVPKVTSTYSSKVGFVKNLEIAINLQNTLKEELEKWMKMEGSTSLSGTAYLDPKPGALIEIFQEETKGLHIQKLAALIEVCQREIDLSESVSGVDGSGSTHSPGGIISPPIKRINSLKGKQKGQALSKSGSRDRLSRPDSPTFMRKITQEPTELSRSGSSEGLSGDSPKLRKRGEGDKT